jgi:hypothetical protein
VTESFENAPKSPQVPDCSTHRRDPEDRSVASTHESQDKMLDKTLADSFPTSDPPSTIPNPGHDDSLRTKSTDDVLRGMPPGTWAAVSIDTGWVVGTGASREEAETIANRNGHGKLSIVQVPAGRDETAA